MKNHWLILGPIAAALLGLGVAIADADTVCHTVNGKLFCYDSSTQENTTCRVINGVLYCS